MAGEFLNPADWPLWMQSGSFDAPQERTMPQDLYTSRFRKIQQEHPAPWDQSSLDAVTSMGLQSAMPMGLAMKGIAAAPKTIAAMLAAGGILGSTSGAGQAADQVDPLQGEIDAINARLGRNNDEVVRLGTTMTKSPKGTQATAIQTLQGTIRADQDRLQTLQGQIAEREQQQRAEAQAKHDQEAPFQERFAPYSYAAPFIGPVAGGLLNHALGRYFGASQQGGIKAWDAANSAASKLPNAKKFDAIKGTQMATELGAREAKGLPLGNNPLLYGAAAGGAAGALEGGAVPYFMNEYDAQTLPSGSPNQVAAQGAATNPNWWMSKVALPAGMGALAGALGGYTGVKAKGPYADPSPKTAGLLAALEARSAQELAAAQRARQVLPGMSNAAPGVPPALGPASWYARQMGR